MTGRVPHSGDLMAPVTLVTGTSVVVGVMVKVATGLIVQYQFKSRWVPRGARPSDHITGKAAARPDAASITRSIGSGRRGPGCSADDHRRKQQPLLRRAAAAVGCGGHGGARSAGPTISAMDGGDRGCHRGSRVVACAASQLVSHQARPAVAGGGAPG